jgi:tetratricopeptide (TPR) repeat protein
MRNEWLAVGGVLLFAGLVPAWGQVSCPVAQDTKPSDARNAFLSAHYDQAATLYQAQLAQAPNDPAATAGLVQALLHEQKWQDAEQAAQKALAVQPNNGVLLTALAEAQLRAGEPWTSIDTLQAALKADPCNPRVHLLYARIAELRSMYATSLSEARTAHQLDPHDPEIRNMWIWTLAPAQRRAELEAYLALPTGDDPEDIRHMREMLDFMEASADLPRKPCRLVSTQTSTQIPFAYLMYDANRIRAFGLDVKLNGTTTRLQIDTGAGGILISRSVAQRAGLKAVSQTEMGGVGSQGFKNGYTAYADSIQIGGLEFQNCAVRVLDSRNVVDEDGLIGMDVFAQFLVTLDYPMRKLGLDPLPPRPGEAPTAPSLKSDQAPDPSAGSGDEADSETESGTNKPAASAAQAPPRPHGPYDRYVAPEMKDWTTVYRVGHELMLPVNMNKKVTKLFILDTGAWATSVSPDAAREVTKVSGAGDDLVVRGLSGKVQQTYFAKDITFYFAHLGQRDEQVPSFDTANISKDAGLEISGFIGANTIGLTTLKIDYRDGLIHFDYTANRGYLR